MTREEWEADGIRRATGFVVRLFLGSGRWYREDHFTLDAALVARERIGRDEHGRTASVYAVTPNGQTIHVK